MRFVFKLIIAAVTVATFVEAQILGILKYDVLNSFHFNLKI